MSYHVRHCVRPSDTENITISGCLCFGPNTEKTNEIFNKIFTQNYSESALKKLMSDPELRVNVMENIIATFNCEIHYGIFIKENIGFVIWMIGEYSLSISEIENGLYVIRRSIGELPFPNSSNDDGDDDVLKCNWFEECRRRLLIDGDTKLRMQVAIALNKLIYKQKVFIHAKRLRQERTEAVRIIASMQLLPKPVNMGRGTTIDFYSGKIRRCMLSICYGDKELRRISEEASGENLISLLSKKLQEDQQKDLDDQALYQLEAIFLGSKDDGQA